MRAIVQEVRAIWAAGIFFTRVPLPSLPHAVVEDWRRASTYFPLIGWLAAAVAVLVWWSASKCFPATIACGLSMGAVILLTGAMHEDGLADFCDGFGGGWNKEKILMIMRDSRTGAFGVLGLIMVLGLKWQTLSALPHALVPGVMVASQTVSRAGAISLMGTLDYAGAENGKARPLSSRLGLGRILTAFCFGLATLALLPLRYWWAVVAVGAVRILMAFACYRKIGGYTGDCLGAAQQFGELAFLLTVLGLA